MMVADTRRFGFENGRSVQPNNPCMLCGRISDTGLYSFCYRRIEVSNTAVDRQINRHFGKWLLNGRWPLNRGRTVLHNYFCFCTEAFLPMGYIVCLFELHLTFLRRSIKLTISWPENNNMQCFGIGTCNSRRVELRTPAASIFNKKCNYLLFFPFFIYDIFLLFWSHREFLYFVD